MAQQKKKKPSYDMYKVALALLTFKVKISLDEPDSETGRKIARTMEERTGIHRLKIQRLHNAILTGKIRNHFAEEEIEILSWQLFKAIIQGVKFPNTKMRGEISKFANEHNFSLNLVLQTFRAAYCEIIEEVLADQKET